MENLTIEALQEKLKELIGKEFKEGFSYSVYSIVRQFLIDNHYDTDYRRENKKGANLSYHSERYTVYFYWCGECFLRIEVRRRKGETHSRPYWNGGDYTDYYMKGFDITTPNVPETNIEEALKQANKEALEKEIDYDIRLNQAVEAFKMVMKKFGMDKWRARDLFEFTIGRAYYDVLKKIDPEK